jgi:hypothetical protein
MDAEVPLIAQALDPPPGREGAGVQRPSCPVILTGPDADLLASRLEPFFSREAETGGGFCIDPRRRRGWAGELLNLAKDSFLSNNRINDVFSGPEYIRPSDAELKSCLDLKNLNRET